MDVDESNLLNKLVIAEDNPFIIIWAYFIIILKLVSSFLYLHFAVFRFTITEEE